MYSLGYYTGNPKSRIPGFYLGLLALTAIFGCSISTAAGLLGWWWKVLKKILWKKKSYEINSFQDSSLLIIEAIGNIHAGNLYF